MCQPCLPLTTSTSRANLHAPTHDPALPPLVQPRAETFDEGRLRELSEGVWRLDRALMRRMSDARLLKGETLADLAKSGAIFNPAPPHLPPLLALS